MNLTKFSEKTPWVCLFAGKSSSGKSAAAASFAEEGPLEIMDINRRAKGILGCVQYAHLYEKINVWRTPDNANDLYDSIASQLEIHLLKSKTNQLGFKTLVLEEITVLAELMILSSIKLRTGDSKGHKIRGKHEFAAPDDYNYVSSVLRQIFYEYLLPLRCNIIVTAWIVDEYSPNPDSPYLPSVISGQVINTTRKLTQTIPGMFDEVWLFEKEEEAGTKKPKHKVYFQSALARTTIPALQKIGSLDITGKHFYNTIKEIIEK